jgi:catechol 2,3-dioxygenase-like lactoylglutathione lyase family enzyme
MMEPRLSLVTLGVGDIARARHFYESLGWVASSASNPHVVFFQLGGMALSLYGRDALAEDAQVPPGDPSVFRGVTLGQNCRTREDVDRVIAAVVAAGGRLLKPAQEAFWGGYSGYVADPDDHVWEIAWNPHFPIGDDGALCLPA